MRIKQLSLILLLSMCVASCTKYDHVEKEPSLLLIVSDDKGELLSGAIVILYDNYDNWFLGDDPVQAGVTDNAGRVTFEDLEEKVYYFDVSWNDLRNYPAGIYRLENSLARGYVKTVEVSLYKYGSL